MRKLIGIMVVLLLVILPACTNVEAKAYTQVDIQEEIDAQGQGDVLLKAVTYQISAPIIIPSGINLIGQGSATELLAVADTRILISENGATDLSISNLTINGDKADTYILVYFGDNERVGVDNVVVKNGRQMGMFFQRSSYVIVTRSLFINNGGSIPTAGEAGLWFTGGSFNLIDSNIFKENQYGFASQGMNYSEVSNNRAYANNVDAINLTNAGGGKPHSTGNIVTGNILMGPSLNGTSGIHLNRMMCTIVSGNFISGFGGYGIALDASSYNNLNHNTILNIGWAGIAANEQPSVGSSHNKISNNLLMGNCQTGPSQAGIHTASAICSYNDIHNNTVRKGDSSYQNYGIQISGVANIVSENDLYDSGLVAPIFDSGVDTVLRDNRS